MKYTVFYKPDGAVVAIVPEQANLEEIKIGTFEVGDGYIIDSIDTSKAEHTAVSHATPMGDFAKLREEIETTNRHLEELNRKRSEETEEMRKAILANATMMAGIMQPEENEEGE